MNNAVRVAARHKKYNERFVIRVNHEQSSTIYDKKGEHLLLGALTRMRIRTRANGYARSSAIGSELS